MPRGRERSTLRACVDRPRPSLCSRVRGEQIGPGNRASLPRLGILEVGAPLRHAHRIRAEVDVSPAFVEKTLADFHVPQSPRRPGPGDRGRSGGGTASSLPAGGYRANCRRGRDEFGMRTVGGTEGRLEHPVSGRFPTGKQLACFSSNRFSGRSGRSESLRLARTSLSPRATAGTDGRSYERRRRPRCGGAAGPNGLSPRPSR